MQNPTECVLIGNENIRVDLNLIHENSIFNVFFTTMQCVQWLSYLFPPCIIITMVINCHHHPYHHHIIIIMHFSSISAVYHLQITDVCVLNVTAQSHSEHTHHATWQISPHMTNYYTLAKCYACISVFFNLVRACTSTYACISQILMHFSTLKKL